MTIIASTSIDSTIEFNDRVHRSSLSEKHFHISVLTFLSIQLQGSLRRKTGPRSNKIKQMQKQNTEDTQYKRDTDLRGSPSVGYVHQRNCQVLPLLLSSK
jgi:hypothetical protein